MWVQSLENAGQSIYHTAPGPMGEVMINLRNDDKSVELLIYAEHQKFVRLAPNEPPQQGPLTPENLQASLHWLNQ